MPRRDPPTAAAGTSAALGANPVCSFTAPRTVLHAAFGFAEIGFDPIRVSDSSSLAVVDLIFEAPLPYDDLARPARLKALTAIPEVSADFKRFAFTIRQGIVFADDPVFRGRPCARAVPDPPPVQVRLGHFTDIDRSAAE